MGEPKKRTKFDLEGTTTRLLSQRHGKIIHIDKPDWVHKPRTPDRLTKLGLWFGMFGVVAYVYKNEKDDVNQRFWFNFAEEVIRLPDLQRKYKEYAKIDPQVAANRNLYEIRQAISLVGGVFGAFVWGPSSIPPFTYYRKPDWKRKAFGAFYGYTCTRILFHKVSEYMVPPESRMEANNRFAKWMDDNIHDVKWNYRPAVFRKRLMANQSG
ncbi:hypothetical protein PROFUN_02068 [Planoprotostelium fungivorum]|uniref:Uncharacterized protein n=1 Tax=Planoprotostelium fungivorum TaxID=1890364 RepID=A0A2P6NBA1_9EUKA|nr:hypothetical protein PROFUN_02068 [Planoprotostelium fungivorum]